MYAQSRFEEFNTVEAQVGVSRFIGDLAPVTSPGQGYRWGATLSGLRQMNPYLKVGASIS